MEIYLENNSIIKSKNIQFQDNGYYWYLYPIFEDVYRKTGQMIDLYEHAEFNSNNLRILETILITEIGNIKINTNHKWEVFIGEQIKPFKKKIFKTVFKNELLDILNSILNLIKIAIDKEYILVCYGD